MTNLKRYTWFFVLLTVLIPACSWGVSIKPATVVTLEGRTIYNDGNLAEPDSIRIQVNYNGAEVFDAWYNSGDAECSSIDGWLVFTDAFSDVDGAGGVGIYSVKVRAYDDDSSLYTPFGPYHFEVGLADTLTQISTEVAGLDGAAMFDITGDTLEIIASKLDSTLDSTSQIQADIAAVQTEVDNVDGSAIPTDESISQAVMDSIRNEAVADTVTGSYWAWLAARLDAISDTAQYLVTATGFSTFDASTDSVLTKNPDAYKADVTLLATTAELQKAIDSINAILDTLQLYDTRLALEASVTAMRDSLQYLASASSLALLSDSSTAISAKIDTGFVWSGFWPTANSKRLSDGDCDTLWILFGTDTLGYVELWHVGGYTGQPPDSTKSTRY